MDNYEPLLPSDANPEKLRGTANKIIYIIGGIGLVALIAAAIIFWIIPMTNRTSGTDVDSSNGNSNNPSKSQYESCLRAGKTASDCLKYLK